MEDARAPVFALRMASTGILASGALVVLGVGRWAWAPAIGLVVAGMPSIFFDRCIGCLTYTWRAHVVGRLRGGTRLEQDHVPLPDLAEGETALVEFMHPMCSECIEWRARLERGDRPYAIVNVQERPELARRYDVRLVPTVLEVRPGGDVVRQVAP